MDFTTLISSVPNLVWSGLLGSLFTLGGVLLSNWGNSVRLDKQLKHDLLLKSQGHTASLRKEIYLDAAKKNAGGVELFN